MNDENIDILRDLLHSLILSNADHNTILKISQKLDRAILKFMYEDLEQNNTEK